MRIAFFIYGILKALKTLIWHGVLYLFYIACPNTILLSFLYIVNFVKLDVTQTDYLPGGRGYAEKHGIRRRFRDVSNKSGEMYVKQNKPF